MTTDTLRLANGREIVVESTPFANGTMKDVHRVHGSDDVLAVFREPLDEAGRERLSALVDVHRGRVLDGPGGGQLAALYRWPDAVLEWRGRTALLVPSFEPCFLFTHGSRSGDEFNIRGQEKQGKWFASARHRQSFLDERERGRWPDYLAVCASLARAVRRLHAAGLAHSDLSYRNVLVDPLTRAACVIDIDGLVVPGKFPPDVAGTPEFIAPEVIATRDLDLDDPARVLPSIDTDRHALAVLVYLYLLGRHPLQGQQVHDHEDAERDEFLGMGEHALWIESPTDDRNRVDPTSVQDDALPWGDPKRMPYALCGPLLGGLFERAFGEGLHDPLARPSAEQWEQALVQSDDLLVPCTTATCTMGDFVFVGTRDPVCPACRRPSRTRTALLNLYSARTDGAFRPDGHRIVARHGLELHRWHVNRFVFPNERLATSDRAPVAHVEVDDTTLFLVNDALPGLRDVVAARDVPIGERVMLADDARLLLSVENGGRLAQIQSIGN